MSESSEQLSQRHNIALGKTVGQRVLGIIPPLSAEEIDRLPQSVHFRLTHALAHRDNSQALHFDASGSAVGDLGFQAHADEIAEHLGADVDHTVRRIFDGTVFDRQAMSRDEVL